MEGIFRIVLFLSFCFPLNALALLINEVDADQLGVDRAEFVEFWGDAEASLDGYFLVLVNGRDLLPYASYSLQGARTDASGVYVLDNSNTRRNFLQNGVDALALFMCETCEREDFLNTSVFTRVGNGLLLSGNQAWLGDALVYGSNDVKNDALLDGFGLSQQYKDLPEFSMQRVWNNGVPTQVFESSVPTPGKHVVMAVPVAPSVLLMLPGMLLLWMLKRRQDYLRFASARMSIQCG